MEVFRSLLHLKTNWFLTLTPSVKYEVDLPPKNWSRFCDSLLA
jgi:hypothetical protein